MVDYYQQKLNQAFGPDYQGYQKGNHQILISSSELTATLNTLKYQFKSIMLLDVCGVDNFKRLKEGGNDKRFESVYHLLDLEHNQRIRVKVPVDGEEILPSIDGIWKSARWFEREAFDMFGIKYEGNCQRLLTHDHLKGHPLKKDFIAEDDPIAEETGTGEVDGETYHDSEWVNIGPAHPGVNGSLCMIPLLQGEKIRDLRLKVGYLHRGVEKLFEQRKFHQIVTYTERINHTSSMMNSIGWCKAVEDLVGISIPDRAGALRMVAAELNRVMNHLALIGDLATNIGIRSPLSTCQELKESVVELLSRISGKRGIMLSWSRIGGVAFDLPIGWIRSCFEILKKIEKGVATINRALSKNRMFMERTRSCSVSAAFAVEWGYTGPCLRASGVNYDIRKNTPYYFYGDVDFEVPLGINGDTYDRYLVCLEEIRQSIGIVGQVLDGLPHGDLIVDDALISLPAKEDVFRYKGALLDHYNLIIKGIVPPPGEIYSATEAANGELGFYIISDGGANPYRVKVRPPSYTLYQSLPEVVKGSFLSDAMATLVAMNVVAGELDR